MQFVAQRRTNSLLIIAPPAEFEQIEALLKQLDQPLNKTEVSPHIYHVRNIDAKELSDVLNDIFGVEGQNSSSSGYYYYMFRSPQRSQDVGRLYGKVRFVHEPATNSIIVITNNKENFPIIEDLIAGTRPHHLRVRQHDGLHAGERGRAGGGQPAQHALRGAGRRPAGLGRRRGGGPVL